MSIGRDVRKVWGLVHPERWSYALGLSALFLVNVADAFSPVFMAVAIDLTDASLSGKEPATPKVLELMGLSASSFTIVTALACYLGLLAMANLSRYPMLMYTAVPSHRIGQSVRNRLAGHLLKLSQPFYDRSKSGDLMSLATSDVQAVRMMVGPGILVGSDVAMIVSLTLLVMFGLSWQLTLVALIPLPLIAIVTNVLSHMEYERFEAVQEDIADVTERARESYAGVRIIQGYAREGFDRARFEGFSLTHYAKNMALARVRSLFDPTLDLFMGASKVLVFTVGGLMVVRGELGLGTFVAFLFLVSYLSGPMIGFGWAVSLFQRGRASLGRIEELWATEVEIEDAPEAVEAAGAGALSIRDLSFEYAAPRVVEDDEEGGGEEVAHAGPVRALAGVSVEVGAGQTLGVIGPVGSGKSTLARLLVRLYEPPEGSVRLDGRDVRGLTLASLRRDVVMAPQDTFLFSDTVERNVLMAADGDADATTYTRLSALHDEIGELSEGYATMLGERGVNLSGGQRQRLAIARAIAADPKVLILDDCLSAVDARTEEAILEGLRRVFEGRTGVIISHRVRAVQRCDQIIVLEAGEVIERGTHDELLAAGGYYARIAAEQSDEGSREGERGVA
jgi:ATP-binding cassette subfamily B protein